MQSIVITTGLLVHTVCVDRLLKYKQEYGADEITWKRLKNVWETHMTGYLLVQL